MELVPSQNNPMQGIWLTAMCKLDHDQLLPAEVQKALAHLHRAYEFALDVQIDIWEFAEPLPNLVALGVEESSLRWLVLKGYAEHARELTTFQEADRRFRPSPNISFTPKTCFVLTKAGTEFLRDMQQEAVPTLPASILHFPPSAAAWDADLPHWDSDLRVLVIGGRLVKQYRQPASNQEAVLDAFERARWPHIITDPMPPVDDICSDTRLRETIRRLNTNQTTRLLRFHGDGTGRRVRWERVIPLEVAGRLTRKAA
ncbi:MAG: hypothetical protein WCJ35_23920 [Planctomycetota bacterium]